MKRLRRIPILLMILAVCLISSSFQASVVESSGYPVVLNGETVYFETAPFQTGGTMMVPMREWANKLGASVEWDASTHSATAVREGKEWKVSVNQTTAYRNGTSHEMEQPAVINGDHLMVPLRAMSEGLGYIVKWDSVGEQVLVDDEGLFLPKVGTYDNLKALLAATVQKEETNLKLQGDSALIKSPMAMESAAVATGGSSADFSGTNLQVEGVDEGDLVKTDGEYIYQVNENRVIITSAVPATDMKILSTIDLNDVIHPADIYVDDRFLVVVGSAPVENRVLPMTKEKARTQDLVMPAIFPNSTKAVVYSLENRSNPALVREVELEGNYVASRKIGDSLYFVTQQYLNAYAILEKGQETRAPQYKDSAQSEEPIEIGYDQITYFPDFSGSNYLHVAGFRLDKGTEPVNVSTYLGAGEQVYVSLNHLYVTLTQYDKDEAAASESTEQSMKLRLPSRPLKANSQIFKFRLDEGETRYVASGTVPGTPINQFAMDEYEGRFRIATTTGDMWRNDEHTSKNNLYILDEAMNVTGKIEGIAPGERIYSVRFMGNRGYMVTFKTVDPLFAFDLSDPASPELLGALKIPGYSDYLHPYDENHLIGFGKEAVEVVEKDASGRAVGQPQAYYQGMKVALFDVSDITRPIELFNETIGDRGTESELLHNHRALLFSKEKNLLAFPVTVAEVSENKKNRMDVVSHGDFVFQGAYIYSLDPVNGFQLRGKISHLSEEDMAKAGQYWYDSRKNVQRILYIGITLYTLSPSEIRANDLQTLKPIQSIAIPPGS